MYIPFDQLSNEARIWIYQANRSLTYKESTTILEKTRNFLAQWFSHGNPLQCSTDILYEQFLVLAVEENFQVATGCAVDASIQFIRDLEKEFQITLLDRNQIAFRKNKATFLVPLSQIKEKIQQKIILPAMLVFDNSITKREALTDKWLIRVQDSWLGRHFRE